MAALILISLLAHARTLTAQELRPGVLAERPEEPAGGDAGRITIARPGERDFIVDSADLISSADEQHIRQLATKLLNEKATPIIVVTIESMAQYGGAGMRIETFAHLLFDQWAIGQAKLDGQLWNTGILLLVSRDDRKARIELGAGWKHEQDALAQQIMNEQIVPRFRQGDFSGGIVAGVEALDKMARGLELPKPPTPWWLPVLVVGAVALLIFTVISLIRRGASGWAWLFWGALFSLIGYLLYSLLRSSMNSGGGGGFSGGSFGGGYSGGGGATGSW
ncbi:MAG TPA: TPM domain-containing protein [Pirellulales bacterium]|nr:TPM domain-containing protein [Pirellulales bacterium]